MVCNYLESFVHSSFLQPFLERNFAAQSRFNLLSNRWTRCLTLGALTVSISSFASADDSVVHEVMPLEPVLVSPSANDDGSLVLQGPTNGGSGNSLESVQIDSIDADSQNSDTGLRVAKRPWLLEKLVGPDKEESVKMDPPLPPAGNSDPPSLGRIAPPSSEDDRWISRRTPRVHAKPANPSASVGDLDHRSARRQILSPADTETPMPLTDVGIESAESSPSLRPLRVENSKPMETFDSKVSIGSELQTDPPRRSDDSVTSRQHSVTVDKSFNQSRSQPQAILAETVPDQSIELDYAGFPKQPIKLTRSAYQMRSKMYRCLRYYHSRIKRLLPVAATGA